MRALDACARVHDLRLDQELGKHVHATMGACRGKLACARVAKRPVGLKEARTHGAAASHEAEY